MIGNSSKNPRENLATYVEKPQSSKGLAAFGLFSVQLLKFVELHWNLGQQALAVGSNKTRKQMKCI